MRGENMCDGTEEVSTGCSSPHTPIPEGTAEREPALRKRGRAGGAVKHTKPLYDACDQQSCWAV